MKPSRVSGIEENMESPAPAAVDQATAATDAEAAAKAVEFMKRIGFNLDEYVLSDPHFVLMIENHLAVAQARAEELRQIVKDKLLARYIEGALTEALISVHCLDDIDEEACKRGWEESRVQDVATRLAADAVTAVFGCDGRRTLCVRRTAREVLLNVAQSWVETNELRAQVIVYDRRRGELTLDPKTLTMWIKRRPKKKPSEVTPERAHEGHTPHEG